MTPPSSFNFNQLDQKKVSEWERGGVNKSPYIIYGQSLEKLGTKTPQTQTDYYFNYQFFAVAVGMGKVSTMNKGKPQLS